MRKIIKNIYLKLQNLLNDEACFNILYFLKLKSIPNKKIQNIYQKKYIV